MLLFAPAAYAMQYFQGLQSVAYDSDTIVDLIPCDVVAALVIAAAAAAAAATSSFSLGINPACSAVNGNQFIEPQAAAALPGSTTIYHAASSQSYPLRIADVFASLKSYWTVNPPPVRLPFSK